MPGTWSKLVTVTTGQTITASERNNEFDNVITNSTPDGLDDASADATAMQSTSDPYPAAVVSLATDLRGELKRVRYLIAQITGQAQWYIDPSQLLSLDGTVSLPMYSFASEPDCGMYRIGTNNIGIACAGTKAIDIGTDASVDLRGTTTNDSAAAGFVGEYVENGGTGTFPATTVWGDFVNISLTAGDWDVSLLAEITSGGATWTTASVGVSTTSGNSAAGLTIGNSRIGFSVASSSTTPISVPVAIPSFRMSLSETTTVYFKYMATYSAGGPPEMNGAYIHARRVR